MKHTPRIFFISAVLLFGTAMFGFWSVYQFDSALTDIATTPSGGPAAANTVMLPAPTSKTLVPSDITFTSPSVGAALYVGCTYPISFTATAPVSSVELSVIDSGTQRLIGSVTSGLSHISGNNLTGFEWKVGALPPGSYYLATLTVNGFDSLKKSVPFSIQNVPAGTDPAALCDRSGGILK